MSTIRANLLLSFISTIIWTARSIYCDSKTTFFDILSNASWVPLKICLFIISAKIAKRPFTLMSHSTSIRVELFSIWLSVIVFLPFIGPSIISTLIDFLGSNVTISLHTEFLKAITTSLSTVFPFLLIFRICLVPRQNSGSLSISEMTLHTISTDAPFLYWRE